MLPVTVYMPAYNVARYVREAVESILQQTFGEFEFIIIDDGSTDETPGILRDLARRDSRIRLITRPNRGVAASANEAIELAQTEFLARMDGDDIAQPQRLEKQLQYMREHPECVALGSNVQLIDEEGLRLYVMPQLEFGHEKIDAALMWGGWPMVQPSCMFRREAVLAAGSYRTELSLHEDHDLFLRLAERGRLDNHPDVLLWYRQRLTSLSFTDSAANLPLIIREARKRRDLPEAPDLPVAVQPPAVDRCRHWAWMSLRDGNLPTARKYARQVFRLAPFSAESWRLMICAWRGR